MPFDIFPQSVTLYPGDTQKLTFRATPPPALWRTLANCTINSSAQLVRTTSGTFGGTIEQRVLDGLGAVEYTFDSNMLPSGAGYIDLQIFGVGVLLTSRLLRVKVEVGTITVSDETPTTLDTITHTIVSGDVLKLEISGQIMRFYLNGTLETTRDIGVLAEYPYRANAFGYGAMASGTPKITPPRFIGQWEIPTNLTIENLWTPLGGTLDDSTDIAQPTFTAGTSPGVFTQTCTIEDSEPTAVTYQTATSTVIIPPLSILSENDITLQPSEVVTFRTNYDNAQTKIVTWSETGGGSFTNGQYTADSAPGTSTVKAVSGNQQDSITVRVPAVMTITVSGEEVGAATPSEVLTLTTNMTGTVNWTASVGTLSAATGATVTWTAPGQSGLEALITATNGTYTVSATIPVLKAFPYKPNRPLKWERKKTVLVSQSENRAGRATRVKNANNEAFETHELVFQNRNLAELAAVQDFWDEHYPGKRFILTEAHRGIRLVMWFDSDIAHTADASCATTYTFRAIQG